MSTCSMAGAPFLFTPVESGLGGLTLGLLAFAKLQITGRCGAVPSACRSVVGGLGRAIGCAAPLSAEAG